jgi:integrase
VAVKVTRNLLARRRWDSVHSPGKTICRPWSELGQTLPFDTCPLIDRFLGAFAGEQTDRYRPPAESGVSLVLSSWPPVARRRNAMGHSEYDPGIKDRPPWNAGRKIGAKRALKPQQVWAIRFWLDRERRLRDRAMFDLAIDSKLRGCDVVKIRIGELVSGARVRSRAIVIQQKTGRPVQFELLEPARGSILAWLERRGGTLDDFVFPSRIDHADHISTRQYARLVDEWVTGIGLRSEDYGTHSLRRTKAAIIYKQTGNLRAVQILLGHTKIESTVRYLGVDVEDALLLAEGTEV